MTTSLQEGGERESISLSLQGPGELAFVEGTMNTDKYIQYMDNYMLPSKKTLFRRRKDWEYQQDNAPCHVSKTAIAYFLERRIPVKKWRARSPDLNPIETICEILDRRPRKNNISSIAQFKSLIGQEWIALKKDRKLFQSLVNSMPKRVEKWSRLREGSSSIE